jgi:hypothetical protein
LKQTDLVTRFGIGLGINTGGCFCEAKEFAILSIDLASLSKSNSKPT